MCGIFCSILQTPDKCDNIRAVEFIENELLTLLRSRGPDSWKQTMINGVSFGGSVLWQQGSEICQQPVECGDIILLLNGDIFNINHIKPSYSSDCAWLASAISNCRNDTEICDIFRTLEGPFSIIFYNKQTKDLYFGRDFLGRNSLIIEQHGTQLRILSTSHFSNACQKAMELPPLGLYKMNTQSPYSCSIFPWSLRDDIIWKIQAQDLEKELGIYITIGEAINPIWLITDYYTSKDSFNFYDMCNNLPSSTNALFEQLLQNNSVSKEVDIFSTLLEHSVQNRVQTTPKYCSNCIRTFSDGCKHAKIAILFSGGIDCSILAVLANRFVEKEVPIDLINVCFEKVNSSTKNNWDAPDRLSAIDSLAELQRLCPLRKWNFIEVNISRKELYADLGSHIKHLIYPLETVLDESIGCAFWFASRGKGLCNGKMYTSSARIVIVGSGADELFGGYTRHRNAYHRCNGSDFEKQASVLGELIKDWQRIPSRNLARDDRVVSDNSKTLRAPFIEENLVEYVRSLKPSQLCCFALKEGLGDKLFLRIYGYKIGLRSAVSLRKRAIQFGSKIANKKQSANEKSNFLKFE